jgi:hypothetical protein
MTCTLRRAGDQDISRLLANPGQAALFLHGPPPAMRRVQFPGVLGFILRFLPIEVTEAEPSTSPPPSAQPDDVLDLEGSWHGLHFLFTGTAWDGELPAAFLVKGGTELDDGDDENVARVLDPGQVRAIDVMLQSWSRPELASRYDARRMAELEIHPETLWAGDTEQERPGCDRLLDAFEELRGFVRDTCERGQGLVLQVS